MPDYSQKSIKKKKARYNTGIHISPKSNMPIKYRSGWEKYVCLWFDSDPNVVEYFYEQIKIPYVANIKTNKVRIYYPDFFVVYKSGEKKIIEVKRQNQINNIKIQKKTNGAILWCQKNQMIFEFLTDPKIKELIKLFPNQFPKKKKKRSIKKLGKIKE